MSRKARERCANCDRLQAQVNALRTQVQALQTTIIQLQEQLAQAQKNSRTSSKPPSSDIVKPAPPPPPEGQSRRLIGGQPGHPRQERSLLPEALVNGGVQHHVPEICPDCGHALEAAAFTGRVVQQMDIRVVPLQVEEHRSAAGYCRQCGQIHYGALPSAVARGGLVGPRLMTLIAYLKGVCHASYSTIRTFLRDVMGVTLSRGLLAKVIGKVTAALDAPYEALLQDLPAQARLNVDETGHRDQGEQWWTWCFRASLYTVFKIDPTRSGDVLLEVLGQEFDGVLGCDYFSSYRRYMRECSVVVQFCLAHLIRDVKYLTTLPDARDRAWGERLREALRQLFAVIHRRATLPEWAFAVRLREARDRILALAQTAPPTRHSQNLAQRFREHGQAYFTFITTPGVEPTNNLAEQAIRFVVLDRRVTQGTRGETGRRWCERIWTVVATCTQQCRSVFEYLQAAVTAWLEQSPAPALLPTEG